MACNLKWRGIKKPRWSRQCIGSDGGGWGTIAGKGVRLRRGHAVLGHRLLWLWYHEVWWKNNFIEWIKWNIHSELNRKKSYLPNLKSIYSILKFKKSIRIVSYIQQPCLYISYILIISFMRIQWRRTNDLDESFCWSVFVLYLKGYNNSLYAEHKPKPLSLSRLMGIVVTWSVQYLPIFPLMLPMVPGWPKILSADDLVDEFYGFGTRYLCDKKLQGDITH